MAKDRPPSYQWYPRDFRAEPAVDAMTFDQRGRYHWALDASWLTETYGVAPEDQWRQWMHYTPAEWEIARAVFLPCFKQVIGGVWIQARMQQERKAQIERRKPAQKGAAVTNEKRWGKVAQRQVSDRSTVTLASASASASAFASASETEPKPKDLLTDVSVNGNGSSQNGDHEKSWSEMFDWFWKLYPRRVGKPAAKRAWRGVKPQNQSVLDEIGDGLSRWEGVWAAKEPEFIPYPATFLNQRRWEDKP